jgi:flagellar basal body-associated protein FliL
MDIFSLVIIVVILTVVIVIITRPFFKGGSDEEVKESPADLSKSHAEYQEILARIRDLDFEYNLGKVSVEDYNVQRESLKNQAAAVLQSSPAQETETKSAE